MFGGIAALGSDRLVYAAFNGTVATFQVESGALAAQFTVYPWGPAQVHVSACAVDPTGVILLADSRHMRVRRFREDGTALGLVGTLATPGLPDAQDTPGVLEDPCALLPLEHGLIVGCGRLGMQHGVQVLDADGVYRTSFDAPDGGWRRAQGVARVGDEIWVADSEAGAIRRHDAGGGFLGEVDLHPDLRRPFRLAPDGYSGALMLLVPQDEEDESEATGVARVGPDGAFTGWIVNAGEDAGQVFRPFDIAVLPDGSFAVADLPLGKPPEVRVQMFGAGGQLVRTLFEDTLEFAEAQRAWFQTQLARDVAGAPLLLLQARAHHFHSGGAVDHLKQAVDLYRAAIAADAGLVAAHLGLATVLLEGLSDAAGAEEAYRAAIDAGGARSELLARMAACRRTAGDLDGAIELLKEAVESPELPEQYHDRVEDLGSYYLERAGETPDAMI